MRDLLKDKKKLKKTARDLQKKFIFLNAYCRSVADEHKPRGPKGPYQFTDRSVPVLVIKQWDGKTLKQQLGWGGAARRLAGIVDKAVKKNGPVAPPKALRPLLKAYEKAQDALKKKRIRPAIKELVRVAKAAVDKKKFKDGIPAVGLAARKALAGLEAKAEQALADIQKRLAGDVAAARKALNRLLANYGGIESVKKKIKKAVAALTETG